MFPYIGGKSHHVGWMDPLFPQCDTFVEVFGGAGWTTLKSHKACNAITSVYNDANPYLANVWDCFTQCPQRLLERLQKDAPSNEALYRQYQKDLFGREPLKVRNDTEVASKYLYLQTQVFAGTALSLTNVPYFVDAKTNGKYPSKYLTLQKKLENPKTLARLQQVKVENMDFEDVILKYDGPNTFFYVDPPYKNLETYYSHEFSPDDHRRLAEVLNRARGHWALSYYDYWELSQWYGDYKHHRREVYRSASTRSSRKPEYGKTSRATEILIVK